MKPLNILDRDELRNAIVNDSKQPNAQRNNCNSHDKGATILAENKEQIGSRWQVPSKPTMKATNCQVKNEPQAELKLNLDDLKVNLNNEVKQVVAKRNEANPYQDRFDNNGNFKTVNKQENLHANSQLANILNPVVDKFKKNYDIGECETFVENLEDEFSAL